MHFLILLKDRKKQLHHSGVYTSYRSSFLCGFTIYLFLPRALGHAFNDITDSSPVVILDFGGLTAAYPVGILYRQLEVIVY